MTPAIDTRSTTARHACGPNEQHTPRPAPSTTLLGFTVDLVDENTSPAAASFFTEVVTRLGRLNMLALGARHISCYPGSVSFRAGPGSALRITVASDDEMFDVQVFCIDPATHHTRLVSTSGPTVGANLLDTLFDAVDGLL